MSASMVEPEARTSRIAIASAVAALILAGAVGFLAGRSMEEANKDAEVSPAAVEAIEKLRPAQNPVLSRGDLLALARKAADAFVSGTSLADAVVTSGRRVDLVLPFGCPTTAGQDPGMGGWSYDEASTTLRVSVEPSRWSASDWGLSEEAPIESIEGFWIERPWSSATNCPSIVEEEVEDQGEAEGQNEGSDQEQAQSAERPSAPSAEGASEEAAPIATEHTLAVGQVLLAGGPRGSRRDGRPYEIVTRMQPDKFDPSAGFRLRLVGRLEELPQGGTVRCVQPNGPAQRPSCFVSVEFNQVTIENPHTGEVLGTWRSN